MKSIIVKLLHWFLEKKPITLSKKYWLLLKPGPGPWNRTLKYLDPEKPGLRKTWTLKNLDPEKPGLSKTWTVKNLGSEKSGL